MVEMTMLFKLVITKETQKVRTMSSRLEMSADIGIV